MNETTQNTIHKIYIGENDTDYIEMSDDDFLKLMSHLQIIGDGRN